MHAAIILLLAACITSGCVSIDWDAPKTHSTALHRPPKHALASALEERSGESGFWLLSEGIEALGARLMIAKRAETSIDAQYYFILNDVTGHMFLNGLLGAADRGVRVRLLLDDIATDGYDPGLSALNSHPYFEVRIFNPFTRSKSRIFSGLTEFRRVNRRMHNKSLTVDGVATVIGGRNIGAEYFSARQDKNFGDLDLLGFGPVALDAGRAFDDYWNSEAAVPISVLIPPTESSEASLAVLRTRLAQSLETIEGTPYEGALHSTLVEQANLQPDVLHWAPARLVYDAPEKSRTESKADDAVSDELRAPLREAIRAADHELLVISPYFVPLHRGVDYLCDLKRRGVRTAIVTNSLTSTDVAAVHAGYAPYRQDLLECGVELYETREDNRVFETKRKGLGKSQASLHAKGFVIDRKRLFIGSFNWDPRSAGINTEMGILVESVPLSELVANLLSGRKFLATYTLVLTDGDIRWVSYEDGEKIVLDKEPGTTFWKRFSTGLLELLPIRGQL